MRAFMDLDKRVLMDLEYRSFNGFRTKKFQWIYNK